MKQFLTFLALTFSYMLCGAQATTLVVDNQTPGWLSSKINYGDQQTVENLTITGYLNEEDYRFLGTLIYQHNLTGKLDLQDTEYIASSVDKNNIYPDYIFGLETSGKTRHMRSFVTPVKLKGLSESWISTLGRIETDTLYLGGPNLKIISIPDVSLGMLPKHIIFREGVEIFNNNFYTSSGDPTKHTNALKCESIRFPKSLRKIGSYTFANAPIKSMNLPDNIEEIGQYAFLNCSCFGDEVILPKELKRLYLNIFFKAMPKKIFVGPNVSGIDIKYHYDNNSGGSWTGSLAGDNNIALDDNHSLYIFGSSQPTLGYVANSSYGNSFMGANIFVLEESVETYKEKNVWNKANIFGFTIPKDININIPEYLYVGDIVNLQASNLILPSNWDTENQNVASVNFNNQLVCNGFGKTTLNGRVIYQDNTSNFGVNVYNHTTGLDMSTREVCICEGGELQLEAATTPVATSDNRIKWQSENQTIATVSDFGLVKGISAGVTYITAISIDGNYIKECRVEVIPANIIAESISISMAEAKILVNENLQLHATVLPENTSNKDIRWSSTNSDIAVVSESGLVSALKEGDVQIIASTEDGSNLSAICEISVNSRFVSITQIAISPSSVKLAVGETINLEAQITPVDATNKNVKWSSTNSSVVTVGSNGQLTAKGIGTATIIASSQDGTNLSATCSVEVFEPTILISSITINPTDITGKVGDTYQLAVTIVPENASDKTLAWSSDNSGIASVDSDGLITLHTKGNAIIKASATDGSGISTTCAVVVDEGAGINDIEIDGNQYVRIYNLQGVLVYEGEYSGANLVSGTYIIISRGNRIKRIVR